MVDEDSYLKLSQVQDEIARLRPQMKLASESAGKASQEMRKVLCEQKKLALEQATKLKRDYRRNFRNNSRKNSGTSRKN